MRDSSHPRVPTGAAIAIALVQFLFVTTWTVYVIYLPRLLESAGLPAAWTPWVLVLDQLVFMAADVACGLFADRVQRKLGRFGPLIVGWTAVSCVAFLLLPHAALLGDAAPAVGLVLILVWTTTSSALRAPPWVLLGKYAARPALPRLTALTLMGLAAGGAVAPYLGVTLKNLDPRLPFALASLTLLAATAGIVWVERHLARQPAIAAAPKTPAVPPQPPRVPGPHHATWMLGILLLAAAFQTHTSINASALYLRFAPPAELQWLMPVFWVAFGLVMLPGAALCKRKGAMPVMAAAALCSAGSAIWAAQAGSLAGLIAAQLAAGAAWACTMVAVFSSAADLGRTGREGLALGSMFAMLSLATLLRLGVVLAGVPKNADLAPLLVWLPVLLWVLGGVVLASLAWRTQAPAERVAGVP